MTGVQTCALPIYRVQPRGQSELETLREGLYDILKRVAGSAERGLSPRWKGEDAPYVPAKASVPPWVMAAGAVGILAVLFVGLGIVSGTIRLRRRRRKTYTVGGVPMRRNS